MAEKLTTAAAVRVMLDGGYISEMFSNNGRRQKYKVNTRILGISAGHITPKQFNELFSAGVIESTHEDRKDKYGNVYHFYKIKIV